ncbi:MAG: hypothetical protein ABII13_01980 [Patescibacteria group bacterium]|nr:hypothetical protein [Patescibacteria group bacterium]MBU2509111.1 hypothetical protein [Patescibacteria group bacterium]
MFQDEDTMTPVVPTDEPAEEAAPVVEEEAPAEEAASDEAAPEAPAAE